MKIMFVIDQVYLHGGIERVLSIKANYLSNISTNEIHVITTEQKGKKPCYDFNSNIIFHDISINYNRLKSYFHPKNILKLPKHISRIKKIVKLVKPEVIVVCSHSTDTYFMPFICKTIPKVKEFHYSKFIEKNKRENPSSLFKKFFLKFADYVEAKYNKIIVLNPDEQKYYKSNNTIVIPNPLTFFPDNTSSLSQTIAITAGRIAPVKGYDILIDIWSEVNKKHPEWKLNIYGEGDELYMKKLQDKIVAEKVDSTLKLCGSTNDVSSKMLNSSVYLMTSHNECFPLVLLEAQACGLPIISFDCPHGPSNIVEEGTGYLIEQCNIKAYSEKLITLLKDDKLRLKLGVNARKNAEKYQVKKIMQLWNNLFKELTIKAKK